MRSAAIALLLVWPASIVAQQPPETASEFTRAATTEKGEALARIIKHESSTNGVNTAALVQAGIHDTDTLIRETALAAIVARAAGPRFSKDTLVGEHWRADREHLQRLRADVVSTLRDPIESVRLQALAALVSLDFDIVSGNIKLSNGTERILADRFYADSSGAVRTRIVSGFGTDEGAASQRVKRLLVDAFSDSDFRVRHAAMSGTQKLGSDVALPLVTGLLKDNNSAVRSQAASALASFGPVASSYVPQLKAALVVEKDSQARYLMEAAVSAISQGR